MGLYEFSHDTAPTPVQQPQQADFRPIGAAKLSDVSGGRTQIFGDTTEPEHVEEYLMPGFSALDDAMKYFWSGMRVPTKDAYRLVRIKVAGGDKSVLVWNDELADGRAMLPVASINRGGQEFNAEKFSPPYLAIDRRFITRRMDQVALIYRPVPFLVDYTLTAWTASKRDADYILGQVLTRFNPLAEFMMYDEHIYGSVQLRFGGSADASEKEAGFDQRPNTRYEFKMTAEAWLPLPERVVPTVLGHIGVCREMISKDALSVTIGGSGYAHDPRVVY